MPLERGPLNTFVGKNPRWGTWDFKWRGWSNGAKSQDPKKNLGLPAKPKKPKIDPKKNHMPILWPLKVPQRGNAITQRKTLEIEHLCLFIHHTIWIYPSPHLILFNTPKKSLLKSSYPSQIFVPKKIPESKISNPKKSFDHPCHLKSRVPPPWGKNTKFESDLLKSNEDIAQICEILQTKLNFIVAVTKNL